MKKIALSLIFELSNIVAMEPTVDATTTLHSTITFSLEKNTQNSEYEDFQRGIIKQDLPSEKKEEHARQEAERIEKEVWRAIKLEEHAGQETERIEQEVWKAKPWGKKSVEFLSKAEWGSAEEELARLTLNTK